LLQNIFEIYHAKEITCGHQITTEVTGARQCFACADDITAAMKKAEQSFFA